VPGQAENERRRTDVNLVNNVVYGWGDQPTHRNDLGEVRINFVGNYFINGPANKSEYVFREGNAAPTFLYQEGNLLDADQDRIHNGKPVGLADDIKQTFRQFDAKDMLAGATHGKPFNFFVPAKAHVLSADETYARVVKQAGASLSRDAIDTRIIDCVVQRTGSPIDSQEMYRDSHGSLPGIDDLPTSRRPGDFDTDGDGMPNEFERLHRLNPHNPADRNGFNLSNDGYTNLEIYLNGLVTDASHR
jgi:hypothetical protein